MAFNAGSGWERVNRDAAKKIQAGATEAVKLGRISDAEYKAAIARAATLNAKADTYVGRTAFQTISGGLPKIAKVAVSTVGGLLTGGPSGAASGFAAGATSFSGGSTGVTPTGVDVSTPPIVRPQPQTTDAVTGSDRSGEPMLILLAWVAMLWVLFKRRRK